MTLEYIRYRIAEPDRAEFEAACARAAVPLASAPQCRAYELSHCEEEPGSYILRIDWTSTEDHLKGFRASDAFHAFVAEVRPYVRDIEEMRHYAPTRVAGAGAGAAEDTAPNLYEWAGGAEAWERLTEAFYREVHRDDLLEPLFRHMDAHHPHYVALWLAEVFGGPEHYTEERGGFQRMADRHLGKGITEQQRRRWISLLMDAADEVGLPADPEFRSAFTGYIEWGTRLAVANSRPGAGAAGWAPVPKWGWGVAPPRRS
ncbi:group II truncated hemoglobin [Murinocardiopsis flavida]|nr:antibiotic biosynthesis monooxygenase [Murinocardiopsis flavida]